MSDEVKSRGVLFIYANSGNLPVCVHESTRVVVHVVNAGRGASRGRVHIASPVTTYYTIRSKTCAYRNYDPQNVKLMIMLLGAKY